MPQSSAFISYHHSDWIIGSTLADQLLFLAGHGQGKPALSSFLDARDIDPGTPWQPVIDKNLSEKDWLIVIFTGDQSVYCGYEIGTFSQLNGDAMKRQSPDKHIMGLYDVRDEALPVILKSSQNTTVPIIDKIVETQEVTLSTQEVNFWYQSPVGKFLVAFCTYRLLYTPEHETADPGAYSNNIALAAKRVANAFGLARGTDVKFATPTQIGFELTIKGIGEGKLDKIPDDARVVGTSLFFDILELALPVDLRGQAPNTTWGNLGQFLLAKGGPGVVPWMHKVETDVVRAISHQIVSADDVTFVGKNRKVYRPILVRHDLFVNGDRRFYLLLVETLDRRFAGSPNTSVLLTGLVLASRWRFTYFENWPDSVERAFGKDIPLERFADSCKQLFYNIEWIEAESTELGTYNEEVQIDAFGPEHRARVERFFNDWAKTKKALFAAFPKGVGTEITQANQEALRAAVITFLNETRVQNSDFLELALQAYSREVMSGLAKDRVRA